MRPVISVACSRFRHNVGVVVCIVVCKRDFRVDVNAVCCKRIFFCVCSQRISACRRYKCVDGVFVKSGAGGIGQKRLVGIIKAGIDYCYEHSLSVKFHGVVEI